MQLDKLNHNVVVVTNDLHAVLTDNSSLHIGQLGTTGS